MKSFPFLAIMAAISGAGLCHGASSSEPTAFTTNSAIAFPSVLSAAFREFADDGKAYATLHHRHLRVTQPAPNSSSCPTWPEGEFGTRVLRFGFVAEVPLHTVEEGRHVGFEADLAVELVRRINAHYRQSQVTLEWVAVPAELPVGPAKNATEFRVLADGLRARRFDVAFSSIVPVAVPDISYLCPTMTMFPGVAYTGLGNLDVSSIRDRPSLVAFLAAHPGLTFVHGMGVSVFDALAADVSRAGGSISVAPAGSAPHFRMADILGLSKLPAGQVNLLDVNPRTDIQTKAPFALKP